MANIITRRRFLETSAAAAALAASVPEVFSKSPNEKLNIACVGVGGRGRSDFNGVKSQNIVAICDIDDRNLESCARQVPKAQKFNDYRKMLDKVHKEIDAIVVATPDHMHAPISTSAMVLGKHAYCEKPLAHNPFECRVMAALATKYKLATQMGTQIHAGDNYRRVVELIQAGAIGAVREAHVWAGKSWSNGRHPDPSKITEAPKHLHWDLWSGVAPKRGYAPNAYHPGNWRRFWDYGTGTLGDMGAHYMDVAFWALDLKYPTSAKGWAKDAPHPDGTPHALTSELEFPARGTMPAAKFTWYDGDQRPSLLKEGKLIVNGKAQKWGSGVLFVGDKGMLLCDYGRRHLLPEESFKEYEAPKQTIPKSIGHHNEWIKACKDGSPTTCNFNYSGPLSETILLGNVAYRVGKKIEWDAKNLKATNSPEATQYIQEEYSNAFKLPGADVLNIA